MKIFGLGNLALLTNVQVLTDWRRFANNACNAFFQSSLDNLFFNEWQSIAIFWSKKLFLFWPSKNIPKRMTLIRSIFGIIVPFLFTKRTLLQQWQWKNFCSDSVSMNCIEIWKMISIYEELYTYIRNYVHTRQLHFLQLRTRHISSSIKKTHLFLQYHVFGTAIQ